MNHEIMEGRRHEQERFNFLTNRDGIEEAVKFAKRTLSLYQKALLYKEKDTSKPKYHFSRTKEFFGEFVGSCVELKKIIREHGK